VKQKYILTLVILVAALLRLVGLGAYPVGFTPDEASFGYDAWSLLQTGQDQWGGNWPLVFKSFGDGKLPLQVYLLIPSIALFGLTEFAVRLPNAIFGVLAVWAIYLLVKRIFKNKQLALMSAFLLAISPWHIPLSRGAFEANLTTFLMPIGIYWFFKIKDNPRYIYFSALALGLNLFSYHSARLVTPLIVGYLIIQSWTKRKPNKNIFLFSSVFGFFIIIAAATMFFGAGDRIATSTIFGIDPPTAARFNSLMSGLPSSIARLLYNKYLVMSELFLSQYLQYFSWEFLFLEGPRESTYGMLPGVGVFYLVEAIFIFGLFLNLKKLKEHAWLLVWVFLAPIPAALSIGPGHAANRAVIMLPAFVILMAVGWQNIQTVFKKYALRINLSFVLLLFMSLVLYLETYFVQQRYVSAPDMFFGTNKLFSYLEDVDQNYDQIVVSKSLSEPHIFYAFYTKLDPTKFQEASEAWDFKERGLSWVDQLPEYNLGKYQFNNFVYQDILKASNNLLLVGKPEDFPLDLKPEKIIRYPDNTDAFWVVEI